MCAPPRTKALGSISRLSLFQLITSVVVKVKARVDSADPHAALLHESDCERCDDMLFRGACIWSRCRPIMCSGRCTLVQ